MQPHLSPQPVLDTGALDWIPLAPGLAFRPLRFFPDGSGYQLLLRLEPGTRIGPHRHTGEVHAFNLAGHRRLEASGTVVGPGGYVHEAPGDVDAWTAVGDEPCVIHLEANGEVQYLDDDGRVVRSTSCDTARAQFAEWCTTHAIEIPEALA